MKAQHILAYNMMGSIANLILSQSAFASETSHPKISHVCNPGISTQDPGSWQSDASVEEETYLGHSISGMRLSKNYFPTVDGRNPANQLRLVVYPIIYKVLTIPGGAGFLPSTVSQEFPISNSASGKASQEFRSNSSRKSFQGALLLLDLDSCGH